eukprot:TRINITY_DN10409_c0_g1_i1.p2 TRINITY_DN10409_c0_g1~~TRINITY_DN10409_c0_g1_i1.p2  ORF type:complete len:288 (-),score=106.84 TRINITY_DN10409_c0_g1_i1:210-1073(-)
MEQVQNTVMGVLQAWDDLVCNVPDMDVRSFPIINQAMYILPVIIPLYVLMVFVGPKLMAGREPFAIKPVLAFWNLALTLLSVVMFYATFTRVFREAYLAWPDSLYFLITLPDDYDAPVWRGPQMFWMWVFGLSKVLELFDTVLLIVRKRPVGLLHWYHHTTVLIFTWFCMNVVASPGFVFGIMNSGVHSVMYFYYFLTSVGFRPWWGKIVTQIQLSQMVVGILVSVLWTYYYLFTDRETKLYVPVHEWVVATCVLIYGSYFLLFLDFYIRRFIKSQQRDKEASKKKQ